MDDLTKHLNDLCTCGHTLGEHEDNLDCPLCDCLLFDPTSTVALRPHKIINQLQIAYELGVSSND